MCFAPDFFLTRNIYFADPILHHQSFDISQNALFSILSWSDRFIFTSKRIRYNFFVFFLFSVTGKIADVSTDDRVRADFIKTSLNKIVLRPNCAKIIRVAPNLRRETISRSRERVT